ncbi:MAG: MOSC domain-containing protein [Planctomycetia bacterium]|nr:MOSC domain-containing protein [Planctomycetia bacterium]
MPTLDRITIYPVKSLDGLDVAEARVLPGGALENDRRWQLTDLEGRVVNAKRSPRFHLIRAEFALDERLVTLSVDPAAIAAAAIPGLGRMAGLDRLHGLRRDTFPLVPGPDGPCGWLSEALDFGVLLLERPDGGFPDDRDAPGPTLISTASLQEVGRWFGFDLDETRRRFRANLEIGGCDAFWEDTLASPARPELSPPLTDLPEDLPADPYADLPPPEPRQFSIGDVTFRATNVCRRCVVPTRDSRTGVVTEQFRDVFEAWRGRRLPTAVDASGWGHVYRLAINTVACGQGVVRNGDAISGTG